MTGSTHPNASKLSTDKPAAQSQDGEPDEEKYGKQQNGEGERAAGHGKVPTVALLVDRANQPRQPNTEKDVDGVAASDVPDGWISSGIVFSRDLASERVWDRCSERYKADSGDRVGKANRTSHTFASTWATWIM